MCEKIKVESQPNDKFSETKSVYEVFVSQTLTLLAFCWAFRKMW